MPKGTHHADSMLICLAGEALLESNTIIDHVYCSPSLRCVQTAHNILKGKTLGRIEVTWAILPLLLLRSY